jgi:hypothetical protein
MQPELLTAVAVALGVGFLFGYFVRAMISRRRRRRSNRRFESQDPGTLKESGFRLERPVRRQDGTSDSNDTSLRSAADAPSLNGLDDAVQRIKPSRQLSNPEQDKRSGQEPRTSRPIDH